MDKRKDMNELYCRCGKLNRVCLSCIKLMGSEIVENSQIGQCRENIDGGMISLIQVVLGPKSQEERMAIHPIRKSTI